MSIITLEQSHRQPRRKASEILKAKFNTTKAQQILIVGEGGMMIWAKIPPLGRMRSFDSRLVNVMYVYFIIFYGTFIILYVRCVRERLDDFILWFCVCVWVGVPVSDWLKAAVWCRCCAAGRSCCRLCVSVVCEFIE